MARPKPVIPKIEKTLYIPQDVALRMELELMSDLTGKIPHGAQSELVSRLLREHFAKLDAQLVIPLAG